MRILPGKPQEGTAMKIIPIQEAYQRKFERQRRIRGLQYHAAGQCVHLGKISPGCLSCFIPDPFKYNITSGAACNLDCPYCYNKLGKEPDRVEYYLKAKASILRNSHLPNYHPICMSFSGGGEPLLYLDILQGFMETFREIERERNVRPWYHLYTNGVLADEGTLLRLKGMGFDEIRFHLGASNFAENVYKNLGTAVKYFQAVSVENPAWPPHRRKLFEMLPRLEELGVKHLNLGEIEVTRHNYARIAEILPDAEIYPCYEMHLDDGGLVYDILEEVIRQGYSFSVLDCNCFVKSIQRGFAKRVAHEDTQGLIADYGLERSSPLSRPGEKGECGESI